MRPVAEAALLPLGVKARGCRAAAGAAAVGGGGGAAADRRRARVEMPASCSACGGDAKEAEARRLWQRED